MSRRAWSRPPSLAGSLAPRRRGIERVVDLARAGAGLATGALRGGRVLSGHGPGRRVPVRDDLAGQRLGGVDRRDGPGRAPAFVDALIQLTGGLRPLRPP